MHEQDYYICLDFEDGTPFRHAISTQPNFDCLETVGSDVEDGLEVDLSESEFGRIFRSINRNISSYFDYVPVFLGITSIMTPSMSKVVPDFLQNTCDVVETQEDRVIYKIKYYDMPKFEEIVDTVDDTREIYKRIPRFMLSGLVSALDYHLSQLVRLIIERQPGKVFGSDRKIRISDLMSLDSIDQVKTFVVDEEVNKISRQNMPDQIGWIESNANLDSISTGYSNWSSLCEIVERRNLFVHNDGIVNDQYLKNLKSVRYNDKYPEKDSMLGVGSDYYRNSVRIVDEFVVILTQIVWRKICKSDSSEIAEADSALNRHGFDLIERGEYDHAVRVLKFAVDLRHHSTERDRRMMLINLANAYKLNDDEEASLKCLDSHDWSATSEDFTICVSAVKGDIDSVVAQMRKSGKEGAISFEQYCAWPVFFHVRDDEKFKNAIKETFETEYRPLSKKKDRVMTLLNMVKKTESNSQKLNDDESVAASVHKE